MSNIQPRIVAHPIMSQRASTAGNTIHYSYNTHILYNSPLVTYNYSTSRGSSLPRVITTATMKGR